MSLASGSTHTMHSACSALCELCEQFSWLQCCLKCTFTVPKIKHIQVRLWQVIGQVLQPCEIPFAIDLCIYGELPWNKYLFWLQVPPNEKKQEMKKRYTMEREERGKAHGNMALRKGRDVGWLKGCRYPWAPSCMQMWRGWAVHAHRCGCSLAPV